LDEQLLFIQKFNILDTLSVTGWESSIHFHHVP
jgi:hypothetical protein